MSQTRLDGLALLNIHRDIEVDPNKVLGTFAIKHEGRLRMSNIVSISVGDGASGCSCLKLGRNLFRSGKFSERAIGNSG